jgi:hypothetical protein
VVSIRLQEICKFQQDSLSFESIKFPPWSVVGECFAGGSHCRIDIYLSCKWDLVTNEISSCGIEDGDPCPVRTIFEGMSAEQAYFFKF